jgi:two-component system chemotaxis response regulator CheB
MNEPAFIIVIGASAGGIQALSRLVAQLDEQIDAAIFIVMHLGKTELGDFLAERLQKYTRIPCQLAGDNKPFEKGRIYTAPVNRHLIVKNGYTKITSGPHENRWRPSIDVLFRSAAAAYGERVIGIILTGLLDDGVAGMTAIKKSGGRCVVQDPQDAAFPDMPLSVLNSIPVDEVAPVDGMGVRLQHLMQHTVFSGHPIPEDVKAEAAIAEKTLSAVELVEELGSKTMYTCPDCGGSLWEIADNGHKRYRCHIGHAFSEQNLLMDKSQQIEGTLWTALRMIEEKHNMLVKMGRDDEEKGHERTAAAYFQRAAELDIHVNRLKQILFDVEDVEDNRNETVE